MKKTILIACAGLAAGSLFADTVVVDDPGLILGTAKATFNLVGGITGMLTPRRTVVQTPNYGYGAPMQVAQTTTTIQQPVSAQTTTVQQPATTQTTTVQTQPVQSTTTVIQQPVVQQSVIYTQPAPVYYTAPVVYPTYYPTYYPVVYPGYGYGGYWGGYYRRPWGCWGRYW